MISFILNGLQIIGGVCVPDPGDTGPFLEFCDSRRCDECINSVFFSLSYRDFRFYEKLHSERMIGGGYLLMLDKERRLCTMP